MAFISYRKAVHTVYDAVVYWHGSTDAVKKRRSLKSPSRICIRPVRRLYPPTGQHFQYHWNQLFTVHRSSKMNGSKCRSLCLKGICLKWTCLRGNIPNRFYALKELILDTEMNRRVCLQFVIQSEFLPWLPNLKSVIFYKHDKHC